MVESKKEEGSRQQAAGRRKKGEGRRKNKEGTRQEILSPNFVCVFVFKWPPFKLPGVSKSLECILG